MSQHPQSKKDTDEENIGRSSSGIMGFVEVWNSPRIPFDRYVKEVSRAYFDTRMDIQSAAVWVKVPPAELAAILRLAEMPDEDLSLLSDKVPPKTTWFALAEAPPDGIKAGLDALNVKRTKRTAFSRVTQAIRKVIGPSTNDKVKDLPGEILIRMGKKAEKYNALTEKNRNALISMGWQKNKKKELTPAQVAYITSLLNNLIDAEVIRRDSKDGDKRDCDRIMDALGR